MATSIEAILIAAYAAIEAVVPSVDPLVLFKRLRLREVDLDKAPLPTRLRAVLVTVGVISKDETWSSRTRRWYKGELRIKVGYVSPTEAARDTDPQAIGYEGMSDSDAPLIVDKLLYSAFAAITDMKAPEYLRSDPTLGTSRTHVLSIEWGEAV